MSVTEVWRFEGENRRIIIERLGEDHRYQQVDESAFLPVRADEVGRYVLDEDNRDGSLWARRLRNWVRAELVPRLHQ